MTRKQANEKLLKNLAKYFESYPDIRFGQALVNLNYIEYRQFDHGSPNFYWVDEFNIESKDLLKRVTKVRKVK